MSEYEALKSYLMDLPHYRKEAAFSFQELESLLGKNYRLPPVPIVPGGEIPLGHIPTHEPGSKQAGKWMKTGST